MSSKTTKAFTGHEADDDLGLVNMRGRILDPKLGRFLTTDAIVPNLFSGQSFNAYGYVLNNPLSLVDPSGFQPVVNPQGVVVFPDDHIEASHEFQTARYLNHQGPPPSKPGESTAEAAEVGAAAPPTDVDTTGSWFAPDPSLPLIELPHATGPGSNDPLGIMPPALAVGYEQPLSLLDQFLAGGPSGGRSTFMLPYEPGFFRDLGIVLADDPTVVTLRPPISDTTGPSRREAALGRLVGVGLMMAATLYIPSPDDLALAGGAAGGSAARSAGTAARVGELRGAIPAAQQGRITMGVGLAEDANGVRRILIGTSEPRGRLRPGVTLAPGETLARGLGHAEADIVNFAEQNGLRLLEIGATRPICPSCAALIERVGARPVTPLKVP